jgi:hypothetical protein
VIGLGLLCLAVMLLALAGAIPIGRAPWLWHALAAFVALGAALVAFGVIKV